jgi:hypothetical protein
MFSGAPRQTGDGIAVYADEAAGPPGTIALSEMIEHGTGLVLGQVRAEKDSTLVFGEAVLAGLAVEQAELTTLAEASADGKVTGIPQAIQGAVGAQAAEARKVVHG